MSDWDVRREALLLAAQAVESSDPEKWARFEDRFAALPRTLAPREIDHDRNNAAERFRHRQNEEPDETYPFPWASLNDSLLGGLARGDLVVLAGPGKAGKSVFLDQALETFHHAGANCRLYLSEMSPEKREARWIQRHLGIPMGRVLHKHLDADEVDRIAAVIDKDFPWDATKAHGKGFAEVASMIVRHRPDVAAIDVLTKFNYDGQRDLSNGIATLHAAAESVGACIIIATHLSRAGINRDTGIRRPPTVDDIKDASSVADFADVVFLLNRKQETDGHGKATSNYLPEARLYVPYVRTGEPTTLDLWFNSSTLSFDQAPDLGEFQQERGIASIRI